MPWHDWQFWLVTLLAMLGVWALVRPFMPRKRSAGDAPPACSNCASGSAATSKPRRVALTIEKRRV